MKDFLKTLLATFIGALAALALCSFIFLGIAGAVLALGSSDSAVIVPHSAILKIDFSQPVKERGSDDPFSDLSSLSFKPAEKSLGILSAVQAVERAAFDPSIRFIYMNLSSMNIGMSQLEELRDAVEKFRKSGKPVVAYATNYSQGAYYMATVADKIYMEKEGNAMIFGLGTNIMFFKDLLNRLGVDVQLIRHGKFKAAAEQYVASGISKENYEQNKEMIDSIWESWVTDICGSRGIDPAQLNSLTDNLELYSAKSLKEYKLVDEIVTRDEMTGVLCNLFGVEKDKDLKVISLANYAEAVIKPNIKVKDKIAVIYADGEITMSDPQGLSVKKFYPLIRKAGEDPTVKAVVLRVNSPGGDAQAAEILNNELQIVAGRKPVVVSMGEYAASGGYWISANSDKIFADRTTITGSIGVFSMALNYGEGLKKHLDINAVEIGSNKHSTMYSGLEPLDSKEVEFMQGMVEDIYTQFTELVSNGRDLSVDYVDEVGQGRVWTGADAVRLKLADEIGGISDALDYAAAAADLAVYRIVEYPVAKTPMEQFMEMLQGTEAAVKAFASPVETLRGIYTNMVEGEFRVYARHPFHYEFNWK